MNCREFEGLIQKYPAGKLGLDEENAVLEHLEVCSTCSLGLSAPETLIKSLPWPPKFSEAYWEAYNRKVINRLESRRKSPPAFAWRWASAAALCFMLVGGAVFYNRTQERKRTEEVIANLDVLENLNVLTSEDFDKWAVQ